MTSLSIIIPNYNGKHLLDECLNSIKSQKIHVDIIIIDNGSDDGSIEYIMKNYPELDLIENEKNMGFAAAVNQGIQASKAEFIFLMNNDVFLEENCLQNLLECIKKDEKIFAVSAKMLQYDNPQLVDDAGDEYTIMGWTRRVGFGKPAEAYNKPREIFSACAGAAIYRREVLDEIGLFDEKFFAYMEDVDLSFRARIHGYQCYYCPDAAVYHKGSETTGSRYNEYKVKLASRNNVFVPLKNMPLPMLALNSLFLSLGFLIKYVFFSKKGYGKLYREGIRDGFNSFKGSCKIQYKSENFYNYLSIEWFLIKNTIKFVFF